MEYNYFSIDGFNKSKTCKIKKEMTQSDSYNYIFYKSDSKEEVQWSIDSNKVKGQKTILTKRLCGIFSRVNCKVKVLVAQSCLTLCDSLWPHGR